jgi:hypothetical protein
VQGGQNQMSGLGRLHGDLDRFTITHFSNQNHFGRLTKRGSQGESKGIGITM